MSTALSGLICDGARRLGLALSDLQRRQMTDYLALLHKWNNTFNLTAIKTPEKMVVYHLLDSLAIADYLAPDQQEVVDVGAGAGLPGVPLSILFPDKRFTLLDSNGKKTRFMTQVRIELGLTNCQVVHARVEDWQEQAFDVAVSRAFSNISEFVTRADHLLKPGGNFFAMKGKHPQKELDTLPAAVALQAIYPLQVPQLNEARHLVVLTKVGQGGGNLG